MAEIHISEDFFKERLSFTKDGHVMSDNNAFEQTAGSIRSPRLLNVGVRLRQ